MPYTKEELKEVQFYQSFVSELRNKYLRGLGDSANTETPFRKNGILYSFESVIPDEELGIGLGIENVKTTDDSLYSTYLTVEQQESAKTSNGKNKTKKMKKKALTLYFMDICDC